MSADQNQSTQTRREQGGDSLWPVDWAHIVMLSASIGLFVVTYIIRGGETKGPINWSIANLALLGILFFIHKKSASWSVARCSFIRMGYAALTIPLVFTQLGVIIPNVSTANWEEKLKAFDIWLCGGVEPLTAMEALNTPWLTEILTWIYNYYYFIAIVVGVNVLRQKPAEDPGPGHLRLRALHLSELRRLLRRPRQRPEPPERIHFRGRAITWGLIAGEPLSVREAAWRASGSPSEMRRTIYAVEKIKQDCFPSGHTAVALLALFLAMRYSRSASPGH